MKHLCTLLACAFLSSTYLLYAEAKMPKISGEWFQIFDPNVKHIEPAGQHYIDGHTIVQTPDKKWHLYGTLGVKPAKPWEKETEIVHAVANNLTDKAWMESEPVLKVNGLNERALWSPSIFKGEKRLHMFYGAGNMQKNAAEFTTWGAISHASSSLSSSRCGYRWLRDEQNPQFFDTGNARDPFVIKSGKTYYMYYTKTVTDTDTRSAVAVRTSPDLKHWSGPRISHYEDAGGLHGGNCVHPAVVKIDEIFYMFVGLASDDYEKTRVYWSYDPLEFPEENYLCELKSHASEVIQDNEGNWFITSAGTDKKGIFMAPLTWEVKN